MTKYPLLNSIHLQKLGRKGMRFTTRRWACNYPDSKIHGANMGPTWVLSAPDGPHVGPMNPALRVFSLNVFEYAKCYEKVICTKSILLITKFIWDYAMDKKLQTAEFCVWWLFFNTGSGNSYVPSGHNPLSGLKMIKVHNAIPTWRQQLFS